MKEESKPEYPEKASYYELLVHLSLQKMLCLS